MDSVKLIGPADADHYRRQVGRFGERHYVDPLAADDQWDACDDAFPAVSTVKKATGEDWTHVALKRVAVELHRSPRRLDGLDLEETYGTLKLIDEGGLRRASERGTSVHLYAETRLRGEWASMLPGDPAWDYRKAIDAFFDEYQPQLFAAEIVVIDRLLHGRGYGGTLDALVVIRGKLYLVDWKSRSETAAHRCTAEEAAQTGAYGGPQSTPSDLYWVIDDAGTPRRMKPLPIEGGLIVSIRPDGCRVYPVDLDKGFAHFTALHSWWVARRSEAEAIGKAWAPIPAHDASAVPIPADASPSHLTLVVDDSAQLDELKSRLKARLTPLVAEHFVELTWRVEQAQIPGLTSGEHTVETLSTLVEICRTIEDAHSLPFHADDAPALDTKVRGVIVPRETPTAPTEGETVDQRTLDALANAIDALGHSEQAFVTQVAQEAGAAHRSISLRALPSVRRFEIVRAVLAAIDNGWDESTGALDETLIRAIASAVLLDLAVEDTALPLGEIFGSLTIDQALRLTRAFESIGTDSLRVTAEGDALHISGSALAAD